MEEHPNEVHGITGGRDRLGVLKVTVPYFATSIEEAATVALGRVVLGLPETERTWSAREGALYDVLVTYEGMTSPTTEIGAVRISIKSSFTEEPIEAHPKINEIVEKYGGTWKEGRVIFPPTYKPKSRAVGWKKKDGVQERKNPFCGVEKFKKLEVSLMREYAVPEPPADYLRQVGRVIGSPPGAPPGFGGRKWLVCAPSSSDRGNVVEVSEEYQLLDENFEQDDLHSKEGLTSGGLTTGGLTTGTL